jgi:hypothetical protein
MTVASTPIKPAVQRVSAICAAACAFLAAALPTFVLLSWLFRSPEALAEAFRTAIPNSGTLELWQRLAGCAANLPSAALLAFGFWRARSCLLGFSRGQFFATPSIAGLRDFACAAFWAALVSFPEQSVTSVITTWTNGQGSRELTFGIGSPQVFSALYAGIFWVVAAAMARAAALVEENEQFV